MPIYRSYWYNVGGLGIPQGQRSCNNARPPHKWIQWKCCEATLQVENILWGDTCTTYETPTELSFNKVQYTSKQRPLLRVEWLIECGFMSMKTSQDHTRLHQLLIPSLANAKNVQHCIFFTSNHEQAILPFDKTVPSPARSEICLSHSFPEIVALNSQHHHIVVKLLCKVSILNENRFHSKIPIMSHTS